MKSNSKKKLYILSAVSILGLGLFLKIKSAHDIEPHSIPGNINSETNAQMKNSLNKNDAVVSNTAKEKLGNLVDDSVPDVTLDNYADSEEIELEIVEESPQASLSDSDDSLSEARELLDEGVEDVLPDELSLWDLNDSESVTVDGIPATQTHLSVSTIRQLKVGQALNFTLPGAGGSLTSTLDNASNPVPGVSVYRGKVDIAGESGDVIISQGEIETQFIITTSATVYSVAVDNATGKTVIIDEAEYAARTLPDTPAKLDPSELLPPPS